MRVNELGDGTGDLLTGGLLALRCEVSRLQKKAFPESFRNAMFEMNPSVCDCSCDGQDWTDHGPGCELDRPNFLYFPSGLRVDWYKHIGRGMEVSGRVTSEEILGMLVTCFASLKEGDMRAVKGDR